MLGRFTLVSICFALCTGCATELGASDHYRGSEIGQIGNVQKVTVVHVRPVVIDNESLLSASSGVPTMLSAVAGGLLGANVIGQGNGRYLAGALSGTVSAFIGQTVAKHLSRRDGLEVIVRTEDGRQVVVTQGADQRFVPGETLYLISGAGGLRLTR
ncbi:glycine zipper 2TM domain-containing protein [Cupriavidus pauculus]|uniref:glycine zipper 2TM domain-containing protein n=1 Tax=Cupriavidus pauculus TaxID=82633 RepID=UPI001EE2147E|nr:glycine zipper 2TM domain-containing protein [Cupriavidus pauculus]GJG97741.1 glycine zipper 2TM domain-containing protein [Cupriavidus pauculus]